MLPRAVECFQRALAIKPQRALYLTLLGDVYTLLARVARGAASVPAGRRWTATTAPSCNARAKSQGWTTAGSATARTATRPRDASSYTLNRT
jgi:hypothetical protein